MTIKIPDLLQELLTATADEVNAKTRVSVVRATLEDEARRRLADEGAAPTWKTGLGVVRFDAQGEWSAAVAVPSAFASYVAEHHPENATATIDLNAADLEAVLEAIEFAGIRPLASKVEVREPFGTEFLKGLAVDVVESTRDEDGVIEREFTVTDVDKTTGEARVVPGLTGARSPAKLVVTLDKDQRSAAVEAAKSAAEQAVANATVLDNEQTPQADPDKVLALIDRIVTAPAAVSEKLATALGLSKAGTRRDQARRVALAAYAQESHMAAVLAVLKAAELNPPKAEPEAVTPEPLAPGEIETDKRWGEHDYIENPFDTQPPPVAASTDTSNGPVTDPATGGLGAEALERARLAALELDATRREYEARVTKPISPETLAAVEAEDEPVVVAPIHEPPAVSEPPETDPPKPVTGFVGSSVAATLDSVSREKLRTFAKARNVAPGGSKPDLIGRLVEDGVTAEGFAAWLAANR